MRARPVLWFVVAAALASPAAIGLPRRPGSAAANLPHRSELRSRRRLPVVERRAGHRPPEGRFRDSRRRRPADHRRVRARAGGRATCRRRTRREPTSVAESRAMLENPRARVFVLFLDYYHVDVGGSRNMRDTLVNALDRFLGPEDLVRGDDAGDVGARSVVRAQDDDDARHAGEGTGPGASATSSSPRDPQDEQYRSAIPRVGLATAERPGIAEEMIERRREKLALDALQDLVRSLRGAREERKAVLAISNGWRLFRPNDRLAARRLRGPPSAAPGSASIRAPAGSRPTTRHRLPDRRTAPLCDRDRMALARIDNASAAARHHRRSEPRQRDVLSARSARPRRLRRADHEARDERSAAADPCRRASIGRV